MFILYIVFVAIGSITLAKIFYRQGYVHGTSDSVWWLCKTPQQVKKWAKKMGRKERLRDFVFAWDFRSALREAQSSILLSPVERVEIMKMHATRHADALIAKMLEKGYSGKYISRAEKALGRKRPKKK